MMVLATNIYISISSGVNSRIDNIYTEHTRALKLVNLVPNKFPKMKNILDTNNISKEKKKENLNKNYEDKLIFVWVYMMYGKGKKSST